jgi:hypothetical protein
MGYLLRNNNMVNINMLSGNFAHAKCSTWWKTPKHVTWDFFSKKNPISVYIDGGMWSGLNDKNDGKLKFLWLLESKSYDGGTSEQIKIKLDEVLETYEEIWTHSLELLSLHPKFKWCPAYGSYIEKPKIHIKSKSISMITSDKQSTPQHKFRYDYAIKNKDKFDLFGRGFKEIDKKEEGLNDYMFSVAIENDTYDTYFTEKILDCFLTGTIPIYKGTRKITEHFNSDGIIFLDDIKDFSELTPEYYFSKINSINDNFNLSLNYEILDDWIYKNYLIPYF